MISPSRTIVFAGLLGGAALLYPGLLTAQTPATLAAPAAVNESGYVPPAGSAPPVAPPLKKGSPLDHLANDPRLGSLPAGYKEGNTTGPAYWIAHRFVDPVGGEGWGWLRKSDGGWGSADWIALQETPGLAVAPHRKLLKADADLDCEYKFWGRFATYKAYDPHLDEQLKVFILEGYEVIGPANPLNIHVGPDDRTYHRPSGASSRSNKPILSDPGLD